MTSAAAFPVAVGKPILLRTRPDLVFQEQAGGHDVYWVVKDPLAAAYYHLRAEERAILGMLDGHASFEDVRRRFETQFVPRRITPDQIQAFLARMHRMGLVLAETEGQGDQLLRRGRSRRWRRMVNAAGSLLAIRFRGLDPSVCMDWLNPRLEWLFSRWMLGACAALVIGAGLLLAVNGDVLARKLPNIGQFVTPANAVWFAVALAMSKVLHELGHLVTARHFGARCHELGVMLLVFVPCLYCDVSDAWLLPGKWRRIAISAAGIVVELILAALCAILWWMSEPGLFNTLCLNILVVCSVNSLLFNGNPLLRYDGYYVLSDLVGIPNLAAQSRTVLVQKLAWWGLGVRLPADRLIAVHRHGFLLAYAIISGVYRWIVVFAIFWFCYHFLKPARLELLAVLLGIVVVAGLTMPSFWALAMMVRNPIRRRAIRVRRAASAAACSGGVLALALMVPLPCSVLAPAVVQPANAVPVYVQVSGVLVDAAAAGSTVREGDRIAVLTSEDVDREIIELTGRRNQQRIQLEHLKLRLAADPSVASEIPPAEEALADVQARLRQREQDRQRLVICSPSNGRLLPPPGRLEPPYVAKQLRAWVGSPLDPRNRGAVLQAGTVLGYVANLEQFEAQVAIDQADVPLVRLGQAVRFCLDESPGQILGGTVAEISQTEIQLAPREMAAGRALPVRIDREGLARPLETRYHARVRLDPVLWPLVMGTRGHARIVVESKSLGERAWRLLGRTFHFML